MAPARRFLPVLWLLLTPGADLASAVDRRPYADGPLTKEDFQGQPDEMSRRSQARTSTELKYEYRYTYRSSSRTTTASLDRIDINAYIRRDTSWNNSPENKRLLEHEQGHADNAQIQTLKARLHFRKLRRNGSHVKATAATLKEALAALDRLVKKEMSAFEKAAQESDDEYDRVTSHGLGPEQDEWRRVQLETLKKLEAEWAGKK